MPRSPRQSSSQGTAYASWTSAWGQREPAHDRTGRLKKSPARWPGSLKGGLDIPATHARCSSLRMEHPIRTLSRRVWSRAGWLRIRLGIFVSHPIAVSFNDDSLPVMHQPVDQGRGQGVVRVTQGAPFPERSIRGQHDRSGFITGSDHLEQQIGPALVDRQIAQLIEEEKSRTYVRFDCFSQQAVGLRHNKVIDHVDRTRIANRIATLTRRVTQCSQEMRLSRSGGPNQHGAAVPLDEIAVEQPQDRRLGDSLGEVELILGQGLLLGESCLTQSPLEGALLPGGLL